MRNAVKHLSKQRRSHFNLEGINSSGFVESKAQLYLKTNHMLMAFFRVLSRSPLARAGAVQSQSSVSTSDIRNKYVSIELHNTRVNTAARVQWA